MNRYGVGFDDLYKSSHSELHLPLHFYFLPLTSNFFFEKVLVGLNGLEPSTSRLSGGRSNLLSYKPMFLEAVSWLVSFLPFGGDNRDRTDDPLLAKQVLSQLSYTPVAIKLKGS